MAGLRACCISGHLATGTPTGSDIRLGGVAAYLARPAPNAGPPKHAVVVWSDVLGYQLTNTRLIADSFAKDGGFLTVVPDLFDGGALPPWIMEAILTVTGFGQPKPVGFFAKAMGVLRKVGIVLRCLPVMVPFMVRHLAFKKKVPTVEAVITDLTAEYGIEKIATIGYCYGGLPCLHLAKQLRKVDAFAIAHGQIKVPEDVEPLRVPGLFICAENDHSFPDAARHKAEELLAARTDAEYVFRFYPGTFHGFAIRGDEKDETVKAAKGDAYQQALQFFTSKLT